MSAANCVYFAHIPRPAPIPIPIPIPIPNQSPPHALPSPPTARVETSSPALRSYRLPRSEQSPKPQIAPAPPRAVPMAHPLAPQQAQPGQPSQLPAPAHQLSVPSLSSSSLAATQDARKATMNALLGISNVSVVVPELKHGDRVEVPGGMIGVVRFIGEVAGKSGTYAGVELLGKHAKMGKNNGDVHGTRYFTTDVPKAGIFVPTHRIVKTSSPADSGDDDPDPKTPKLAAPRDYALRPPAATGLLAREAKRSVSTPTTAIPFSPKPPVPAVPLNMQANLYASHAGPNQHQHHPPPHPLTIPQAGSSAIPSPGTPGPSHYLSKPGTSAIPSPGGPSAGLPSPGGIANTINYPKQRPSQRNLQAGSPIASQSRPGTRSGLAPSPAPRPSLSPIPRIPKMPERSDRPDAAERDAAPMNLPTPNRPRPRPSGVGPAAPGTHDGQVQRVAQLERELADRERQISEQATAISEMESNLTELQALITEATDNTSLQNELNELRSILREKNERITMINAEFDAHRADFVSTIDTLELASSETQRVYEKTIKDLHLEIDSLQGAASEAGKVTSQLHELEALVLEFEEGMEEAKKAEALAKQEADSLRKEVDELRAKLSLPEITADPSTLAARDDEIRGLKAIIHSLSSADVDSDSDKLIQLENRVGLLEAENSVMKATLAEKVSREEDLLAEISRLQQSARTFSASKARQSHSSQMSPRSNKRVSAIAAEIGSFDMSDEHSNSKPAEASALPQSPISETTVDTKECSISSTPLKVNSSALGFPSTGSLTPPEMWCGICDKPGHDILNCAEALDEPRDKLRSGTRLSFGRRQSAHGTADEDDNSPLPPSLSIGSRKPSTATAMSWAPLPGDAEEDEATSAARIASLTPPALFSQLPSRGSSRSVSAAAEKKDQGAEAASRLKHTSVPDALKTCALCSREGHDVAGCPEVVFD